MTIDQEIEIRADAALQVNGVLSSKLQADLNLVLAALDEARQRADQTYQQGYSDAVKVARKQYEHWKRDLGVVLIERFISSEMPEMGEKEMDTLTVRSGLKV